MLINRFLIACILFCGLSSGLNLENLHGQGDPVSFEGEFTIEKGSTHGLLKVTGTIEPRWYVYSTTQNANDGTPTIFSVKSDNISVKGSWKPDSDPKISKEKIGKKEFNLEKHFGIVTWSIPVELEKGVDPRELEIEIDANGQVCREGCQFFDSTITAEFAGFTDAPVEEYRAKGSHILWKGLVSSSSVKPGDKITFALTGTPDANWYIYAYSDEFKKGVGLPTLIHFTENNGWDFASVKSSEEPSSKQDYSGEMKLVHDGETTWQIEVTVPEEAEVGQYILKGNVAYQACNKTNCDMPKAAEFRVAIEVTESPEDKKEAILFLAGPDYNKVGDRVSTKDSESQTKK